MVTSSVQLTIYGRATPCVPLAYTDSTEKKKYKSRCNGIGDSAHQCTQYTRALEECERGDVMCFEHLAKLSVSSLSKHSMFIYTMATKHIAKLHGNPPPV